MIKILKYTSISILLLLVVNFGLSKGNEYLTKKLLDNMKEIEVEDISLRLSSGFWNITCDTKVFKAYGDELKNVKISHNIFSRTFVMEFEMELPLLHRVWVFPNMGVSVADSKLLLIGKYEGNIFSKEIKVSPDLECSIEELNLLKLTAENPKEEWEGILQISDLNLLINVDLEAGKVEGIRKISFDGYTSVPFLRDKTIKFNYDLLSKGAKVLISVPSITVSLILSSTAEIFNSLSQALFKLSLDKLPQDELINFIELISSSTPHDRRLTSKSLKKLTRFSYKLGAP